MSPAREEAAALQRPLEDAASPAPINEPEEITLGPHGAGFGTAERNRRVEMAAMDEVTRVYTESQWKVRDVSGDRCGWDLTACRDGVERHLEVKGVSGDKPSILLTRNEHSTALMDSLWRLAVVTRALDKPAVKEYDSDSAIASCEPYVYRVDLE